jgi:adenylate cyclase
MRALDLRHARFDGVSGAALPGRLMRGFLATLLVPLAIVSGAAALRVADPPALESLRLGFYDELQRQAQRPWTDPGVRIVDIDDESLAKIGQWPWPRTVVAALTEKVVERGAAAIAFDIVFAEPDRTSPRAVLPLWAEAAERPDLLALARELPDHDRVFAEILAATPSVLGTAPAGAATREIPRKWALAYGGPDPRPYLSTYPGAIANLPELERGAKGIGSFGTGVERDGVVRRVPLFVRIRGDRADADASREVYPSLVAEILRVAQGAPLHRLTSAGASGETGFGAETGLISARIGQFLVPLDGKGRIWLRDSGPQPARSVPAWRVLAGELPDDALDGALVFVGTSAAGLKDIRATPLNPVAAGVEIHAQIAEQILEGVYLARPDWADGAEILALVFVCTVLAILLALRRAKLGAAVLMAALILWLGGAYWAFRAHGLLFDPVYGALTAVALYMAQTLIAFLASENERRQVRGAFGRYLSPVLVERLARDPSKLALGGEMRPVTLMFMDIRGFTPISEQFDAHGLTSFLNRFLTEMTDAVLATGGTVDKYMGDAIMAFWNAPLDVPDHAARACASAIEMQRRAEAFDRKWTEERAAENLKPVPVKIGIGLNTDICCVGNMGAQQRFDYSAIGDGVNLASRLEGQSKPYGVKILVSEATRDAAGSAYRFVELDLLQVKGKTKPVKVFALLPGAADAEFEAWRAIHDEAIAAYRRQDWDGALTGFARVQAALPGAMDGFYGTMEARIGELRATPPGADWNGVYVAHEK